MWLFPGQKHPGTKDMHLLETGEARGSGQRYLAPHQTPNHIMRKTLLLWALLALSFGALAQPHYVAVAQAGLRPSPSTSAPKSASLSRYDNLEVMGPAGTGWAKARYKGQEGYVRLAVLKPGTARVSYHTVRVGARCKDGTGSNATGRGACSHHGGVDYWVTERQKSVAIDPQ